MIDFKHATVPQKLAAVRGIRQRATVTHKRSCCAVLCVACVPCLRLQATQQGFTWL
jgi:hypothetical protein